MNQARDKLGRFASGKGGGSSGGSSGKPLGANDKKFNVVLSDPNSAAVSMRKATINKNIVVRNARDIASAKLRVKRFYQKRGYKVHDIQGS
jgi:hypothetical protein